MATLIPTRILVVMLGALSLTALGQEPLARLSVASTPDKATVTCDGVLREDTPLTIDGLRTGPHLVLVEKSGYLPVRRTVVLVGGQRSSLDVQLERLTGLVLLRSVPDGADIEINGAHRGKAPLLITDLPPGHYRLKASSAGYLSRNVEFEVENRIPQTVVVSLASDSAFLTIRSQPVGASVKVNGLTKGVTPCRLDRLPAGDNEVVVSLPDYEAYRAKVKLQANEEQSLDITLKAFPSSLSVITTPPGAKLFVDDILRGQSPMTMEGMTGGTHSVRVELDGCDPETRSIELKNGEKKVEEFQLTRNIGTLKVMAKPDGVSVVIDGAEAGTVMPGADSTVGQLSQELTVGEHRVLLRFKGYGTVEKRVTIRKGETVTLKEILKRVFVADTVVKLFSGEIATGFLAEKLPNGDVKLETQLGIYKNIKASDIASIEPLGK